MDLITYLRTIIENKNRFKPTIDYSYIESPIKPVKLIARDSQSDNTSITKNQIAEDKKYKVNEAGLKSFFPKQENWLNWKDPGFRNALLDSQIHTESRGNPNAQSTAGAAGLSQFMKVTWEDAKEKGWISPDAERTDPRASLKAQKELMNSLYNKPEMKSSDTEEERYAKTLAAYNAGYGNLQKAITKSNVKGGNWLNYMSNETKKYIPSIMNRTEEEYFKSKENYVPKYKRD